MMRLEKVMEGLWTFPIALPNNPLKSLNCYVIIGKPGEKNLLIDTGFHQAECLNDLLSGMNMLGITPQNTDVFLTHLHTDHIGNASTLQNMGSSIYMSSVDYGVYLDGQNNHWLRNRSRAVSEGMPRFLVDQAFSKDRPSMNSGDLIIPTTLNEGDILSYGGFRFRCVDTAGHTPGHMCLYDENKKVLILGDHVLFDISPNLGVWFIMEDALGTYMENLKKISSFDVQYPLPAHRGRSDISLQARIEQLLDHHAQRLAETEKIVWEHPEWTAYQIAEHMSWNMHGSSWLAFPPNQKYFAVVETAAHLEHLVKTGRILRIHHESGIYTYSQL